MKQKIRVTIEVTRNSQKQFLTYVGRNAWALLQLLIAGEKGCTPIDAPGPRWSAYVHNLREDGLNIETITEPHGGPFSGTHARYVLRSKVRVVSESNNALVPHA